MSLRLPKGPSGAGSPAGGLYPLLAQMRAANERLVLAALEAQELEDQATAALELAEAARVAAEAAQLEAERVSRLGDEFLAVVSHELRSPVNAVLGWANILSLGQLEPDRAAQAVQAITRSAEALSVLIEDLLDGARITFGALRIEVRPVELVAIVRAALAAVQPAAAAKRIHLIEPGEDTPSEPVSGDAGRLQQVVGNLLSNALKFTPPGGRVEVRVERAGGEVMVRVSDDGQGIGPAFLPHVFERLQQEDGSITQRQSGLGLGLAIARHLVELHGGWIRAESAGAGLGSTFTFALPRLASGMPEPDPEPRAALLLAGLRVLVVEDDVTGREMMAALLELSGATVAAAGSAAEALAVLDTTWQDVMVSDIGMPDQDGYALMREVRRRPAERGGLIPALALSGYAEAGDRAASLAAGFHVHLCKPVSAAELVAGIAALCGRPVPEP